MTVIKTKTGPTELDLKLKSIIDESESLEKSIYSNEEEEEQQKNEIARIEEGFKSMSRKMTSEDNNLWGYSAAGWMSKKLVSKVLNSTKTGMHTCFPIPCKQGACPYASGCIAFQNGLQPPYGQPCVIETTKAENLVVGYAQDYGLDTSSNTDKALIRELVSLDIMMDRCSMLMAKEVDPLQEVIVGTAEDGTILSQQVVSRYYDAWERMARRRQSIMDEMLGTRKSKKGLKEPDTKENDIVLKMAEQQGFYEVDQKPDHLK